MSNNLNQGASIESERAACAHCNGTGFRIGSLPCPYCVRRTPADAVGAGELPPLPEPDEYGLEDGERTGYYEMFRAEKVQQYAREAIAHYLSKRTQE
jgi:hypothetical protein